MSDNPTTKFSSAQIAAWLHAVQQVEKCNYAIRLYESLGLSGTEHDIEHREMREQARRRMEEMKL